MRTWHFDVFVILSAYFQLNCRWNQIKSGKRIRATPLGLPGWGAIVSWWCWAKKNSAWNVCCVSWLPPKSPVLGCGVATMPWRRWRCDSGWGLSKNGIFFRMFENVWDILRSFIILRHYDVFFGYAAMHHFWTCPIWCNLSLWWYMILYDYDYDVTFHHYAIFQLSWFCTAKLGCHHLSLGRGTAAWDCYHCYRQFQEAQIEVLDGHDETDCTYSLEASWRSCDAAKLWVCPKYHLVMSK